MESCLEEYEPISPDSFTSFQKMNVSCHQFVSIPYIRFLHAPAVPKDVQYRIQIPYIGQDSDAKQIVVRQGNIHNGNFRRCSSRKIGHSEDDTYYIVGKQNVDVYTKHFSACVITEESIECCCKKANLIVFGSLAVHPEPLTKLKVFFANLLYNIKDFKSVSINYIRCTSSASYEPCFKLSLNLHCSRY